MGSYASPDLRISAEKNRSAEFRRTVCHVEFRRKKYVQQKNPREKR